MPFNRSDRPEGQRSRRPGGMRRRRKVCVFCAEGAKPIDYKDVATLKKYISERGKILPRRRKGVPARGLPFLCARKLHASPESAHARNQESTPHRSAAVPGGLSHRRNTRNRKGVPARGIPFLCARHRRTRKKRIPHCMRWGIPVFILRVSLHSPRGNCGRRRSSGCRERFRCRLRESR